MTFTLITDHYWGWDDFEGAPQIYPNPRESEWVCQDFAQ